MIETVYRVRVHYEFGNHKTAEQISDLFFNKVKYLAGVDHIETFDGNPAAFPYLESECSDEVTARQVEETMRRTIAENGGTIGND